jgi:hypothetical protein
MIFQRDGSSRWIRPWAPFQFFVGGRAAVSDIFNEVDEEIRRERLNKIWERYGTLIVAAAVLIVAGVGGWRGYEYYQSKKAAETGTTFQQAMTLNTDGKTDEAEAIFQKLGTESSGSYRDMARIQQAITLAKKDPKAGVAAFDAIVADGSTPPLMKDVAALRAGFLLVDTAPYEDMQKRIEPLTASERPFRNSARELLALSAWKAGNKPETKKWVELISNDPTASGGIRNRITVMQALLAADGNS